MSKVAKQRIDLLLVSRGLAESRAKAQAMLMAGEVMTGGKPVLKGGILVPEDADISIVQRPAFVSRGGLKLAFALEQFKLDVAGKTIADIGASTGGFTDCLLQRGAFRVYAIDVGTAQLDYRLRKDRRVLVMEGINARFPLNLPEKVDLVTIDVSFISVEKIIPSAREILKKDGFLIILIKPQFEAKREEVGKGGVIRNPEVHSRVLGRFILWSVNNKCRLLNLVASPILGSSGNSEFLVLLAVN